MSECKGCVCVCVCVCVCKGYACGLSVECWLEEPAGNSAVLAEPVVLVERAVAFYAQLDSAVRAEVSSTSMHALWGGVAVGWRGGAVAGV